MEERKTRTLVLDVVLLKMDWKDLVYFSCDDSSSVPWDLTIYPHPLGVKYEQTLEEGTSTSRSSGKISKATETERLYQAFPPRLQRIQDYQRTNSSDLASHPGSCIPQASYP